MSKRRRTNPNNKFVMLERWFWRCEAWQALPHPARSLYIELEMLYTGSNNGELFLSIRDAAKLLHTGARQAQAAFQALEAGGFIRATRKGSRTRRGEQRLATCWRLTKHADDVSGTPASSDFMKPRKNPTVSPEDIDRIPRGYGTPENDPQNTPDRIPRGHAQAAFEGATVSPEDTHLVYQYGALLNQSDDQQQNGRAALPPETASPPKTASDPPRGPSTSTRFGPWLEAEGIRRGVPPEYVADALGVSVKDLAGMTGGNLEWTRYMRRKAEAALASYRTPSVIGPRVPRGC